MKLCGKANGALVNGDNVRLGQRYTAPGKFIGRPDPADFYPRNEPLDGTGAPVFIAFIVEVDGRTSWAAALTSSGNHRIDQALVRFQESLHYSSPAFVDSVPVRVYQVRRVQFTVNH